MRELIPICDEAPVLLRDLTKNSGIKPQSRSGDDKPETSTVGMERRDAGQSIVAAGVGVGGTERLKEGLSFFLCRCPIPHNQNQGPILLKINNFSKSYQHHVHNFIPDLDRLQQQQSISIRPLSYSVISLTAP